MDVFIYYPLVGAFTGFVAGLLGAGGGLIVVPALIFILPEQGLAEEVIVHIAIGTSLATIVFTSVSSIHAHNRHRAIQWEVLRNIAPGIILGALLGAAVADYLSSQVLRVMFGIFELLVGLQMAFGWRATAQRQLPGVTGMTAAGLTTGMVSAVVGIGGATLTVPFLVWCNMGLRQAVGTSAAVGFPIAVGGAAGFIMTGWNNAALPAFSTGYIYWPALLGIALTSLLFAPLGARLTHSMPITSLRRVFAVFVMLVGLKILMTA